jgi:hypothetical protein
MSIHNHVKDFQTYVIDSPIVTAGKFTDKSGKTLELSSDDVASIFNDVNSQVELIDVHDGKDVIGKVQKYVLNNDSIHAKILITNPAKFDLMRKNGFHSLSPEISIDRHEHSISASLDKIAMSCKPGMVSEQFMTEVLKFDAPESVDAQITNDAWKEPLGEISKKLNELNEKMTAQNVTTPAVESKPAADPNTVTMSKDDLSALIRSSIEEYAKSSTPKVEEPIAKPVVENESTSEPSPEIMDKLNKVSAEYEKLLKRQKDSLMSDIKALGVANPDKLVLDSGLDLSQQIVMLERIKENFANSPISEPLDGAVSSSSPSSTKPLDVDTLLASESFESANDPELRHKLMRMSDPVLMRKYNMNVLFDPNGNFIGQL